MTLEIDFPLPRTHCGLALGNGLFGALIWGVDGLNVTVNRSDFWDHRGGEKLRGEGLYEKFKAAFDPANPKALSDVFVRESVPSAFHSTRMGMGRFEFALRDGAKPTKGEVLAAEGAVRIHIGGAARPVTAALHPRRPILLILDPDRVVADVRPRPAWEWVGERLSQCRFDPPEVVNEDGLIGWAQACPADPAMAALCRRTPWGWLIGMFDGETAAEALATARCELKACAATGPEAFLEETAAWWSRYWSALPKVDVPAPFFRRFIEYALFKFAGATSPESPVACSLQGPWIEEYQMARWSGDYHFNVNEQQIYTLAFPANHPEHLLPLFDMLDGCRDVLRDNARSLVGVDDGLAMIHAIDDRGLACGGISGGSTLDQAVAGWTAQLFWLYYLHTGDRAFLRERALPFMRGVMRVYEEMLVDEGDRYALPLGVSAEYSVRCANGLTQRVGRNPSYQFACIHMLLTALFGACEVLGEEPRPIWRELRDKVPPYTTVGPAGEERIGIWEAQDLDECHRHHSHLASIYPFDTLPNPTADQRNVLENSIERWIEKGMWRYSEWCIPWAAILHGRIGNRETPHILLRMWRDIFINEGLTTVYIPRDMGITRHRQEMHEYPLEDVEIMQLDGTMAGATAMYEMLVHTHGGVTRLFPATPWRWKDVSFENIRQPGPFLVSGRREAGRFAEAEITSLRGGALTLDIPGEAQAEIIRDGRSEKTDLPRRIEMKPDETVRLAQS